MNIGLESLHSDNYDENLEENPFFQSFKTTRPEIFESAIRKSWLICIPRLDSLHKPDFNDADFLCHTIVEYENEEGELTLKTLQNQTVTIQNRKMSTGKGFQFAKQVDILFEETFYNEDSSPYKLVCISEPLNSSPESVTNSSALNFENINDCNEYLWVMTGSAMVKKKVDDLIDKFSARLEEYSRPPNINKYQIKLNKLHTKCFKQFIQIPDIARGIKVNKTLENRIKSALESYIMDAVYSNFFYYLTNCFATSDTDLNRVIRQWHDLSATKANLKIDFFDNLPRARKELNAFPRNSTPLGKCQCLKRMFTYLTTLRTPSQASPTDLESRALTSDDLLSALIFIIIKSEIPNWFAHLNYARVFRFARSSADDEYRFYLSTVEAAMMHVLTLSGKNPYCDSLVTNPLPSSSNHHNQSLLTSSSSSTSSSSESSQSNLDDVFKLIELGDINRVLDVFGRSHQNVYGGFTKDNKNNCLRESGGECHPLCECPICHSNPNKPRNTELSTSVSITNDIEQQQLCSTLSAPVTPSSCIDNNTMITVHSANSQGITALHMAAIHGQADLANQLIEQYNAFVDQMDIEGRTALHLACALGNQDVAFILLNASANINAPDCEGLRPLHYAVERSHEACVKMLLFYGGAKSVLDIDSKDMKGNTALHLASRWGYASIVQSLLENGADPLSVNEDNKAPYQIACYEELSHVLKNYATTTNNRQSAMSRSTTTSFQDSFHKHLNRKASQRQRGISSSPHLHLRASLMPSSLSSLTLKSSANTSTSSISASLSTSSMSSSTMVATPPISQNKDFIKKVDRLLRAVRDKDLPMLQYLLKVNSDDVPKDLEKAVLNPRVDILLETCHPLCQCERCSVVQKLTSHVGHNGPPPVDISSRQSVILGARTLPRPSVIDPHVNSSNSDGMTCLHIAALLNHTTIASFLLYMGADPRLISTGPGMNPLHYAALHGSEGVLSLILLRKWKTTLWRNADGKGNTPLHLACIKGYEQCARRLLEAAYSHGGNSELTLFLQVKNSLGNSALHEAARASDLDCIHLLLEKGANPKEKNYQKLTPSQLTISLECAALLKKAEENYSVNKIRMQNACSELPSIDEYEITTSNL